MWDESYTGSKFGSSGLRRMGSFSRGLNSGVFVSFLCHGISFSSSNGIPCYVLTYTSSMTWTCGFRCDNVLTREHTQILTFSSIAMRFILANGEGVALCMKGTRISQCRIQVEGLHPLDLPD